MFVDIEANKLYSTQRSGGGIVRDRMFNLILHSFNFQS